jgi:hypothetical protein
MLLKQILEKQGVGCGSVKCINLANDMDKWLAPVNTVMNPRIPQRWR